MSETFQRLVTVSPAFDRRHKDPAKNYGIRSMMIRFTLVGSRGAVHFAASLGAYLPHVREELLAKGGRSHSVGVVDGHDIGYHSPEPRYDGQGPQECDVLPGGTCYCDGSALQASDFAPEFVSGGSDAVWAMLEDRYASLFGGV